MPSAAGSWRKASVSLISWSWIFTILSKICFFSMQDFLAVFVRSPRSWSTSGIDLWLATTLGAAIYQEIQYNHMNSACIVMILNVATGATIRRPTAPAPSNSALTHLMTKLRTHFTHVYTGRKRTNWPQHWQRWSHQYYVLFWWKLQLSRATKCIQYACALLWSRSS